MRDLPTDPAAEVRTADAIEVRVSWGTNPLSVVHLAPPRAFVLGEDPSSDFVVPIEVLGSSRAPLVVQRGNAYALVVGVGAAATFVADDGEERALASLVASGHADWSNEIADAYEVSLAPGMQGRVALGDLIFDVRWVTASERIPRGPLASFQVGSVAWAAASATLHAGLALLFASQPLVTESSGVRGVDREQLATMQHYLVAIAAREEATRDAALAKGEELRVASSAEELALEGGGGVRAKGADGAMGNPVDAHTARHVAVREAASFGMVGVLEEKDSVGPAAPWGREDSAGRDAPRADRETATGNMWGGTAGESFGAMGMGIGIGGIGAMGHGGGRMAGGHLTAPSVGRELGSSSIKAGEWDDNANYRDFQRYLTDEETLPIHRVDVSDRHFLVVRDADGHAVPDCPITVSDAHGHRVTLTTAASGHAILFPHAEGIGGGELVASASCAGSSAEARFSVADKDGVIDLKLPTTRDLPAVRTIDVAFVLDTTGSMSEEIDAVRSTIAKVASSLNQQNLRARIGLVEYKDRSDVFVTRVHPLSTDLARVAADIANLEASGGGDQPESVNEGIHVALTKLAWADDAVGRYAFLIGDAPPHLDYPNDFDYAVDMRSAAHRGIQVFTIAASGMDDLGQAVWRQIAQYTDATNLFVLRGGAGPQSVGAGDPKSSCGGTQEQYTSGNLDELIIAKIRRELRGLDRDPLRIAGLLTDENAKPCGQRVAFD